VGRGLVSAASVHLLATVRDAGGDGTPDCGPLEWDCGDHAGAFPAANGPVDDLAASVMEGLVDTVVSLGSMWVNVPGVEVTGGEGTDSVPDAVAGQDQVGTVLDYVQWGGFAVAILSLLILGATMAVDGRRGRGGGVSLGRVGLVLGATTLIAAAAAITAALMGEGPQGDAAPVVAFIQGTLWWYVAAAVVASIIIGAVRVIWERRAQPAQDLVKSLLQFIAVSGAGLTVAGLLITASDEFSVWFLSRSMECEVAIDAACFEDGIKLILGMTGESYWRDLGPIVVIIVGLVAVLLGMAQIVLMVTRSVVLVLLVGLLPLMASATNTRVGESWFRQGIGWLLAFILYKPVAAIIYAVGFEVVGSLDSGRNGQADLFSVLTGVVLLLLALLALPALTRIITPMTEPASGRGRGDSAVMTTAAVIPTGAASVGRAVGGRDHGGPGSLGPSGAHPAAVHHSGPTAETGRASGASPVSSGGGSRATVSSAARTWSTPEGTTGSPRLSDAAGGAGASGAAPAGTPQAAAVRAARKDSGTAEGAVIDARGRGSHDAGK
jgi:hypothetical protein